MIWLAESFRLEKMQELKNKVSWGKKIPTFSQSMIAADKSRSNTRTSDRAQAQYWSRLG